MGDLSKNFSLWEFACPHCNLSNPNPKLITALQEYRDLLNCPIKITSGGRCLAIEGQYPDSQHLVSQTKPSNAADCIPLGPTLLEAYYAALQIDEFMNGGIGIYPNSDNPNAGFLHLDVRNEFARWARIQGTYTRHQTGLNWIFDELKKTQRVVMKTIQQGKYTYEVPFIID